MSVHPRARPHGGRYVALFRLAGSAMVTVDSNLAISLANEKAAVLLGLDPEQAEGTRHLDAFLPAEEVRRLHEALDSVVSGRMNQTGIQTRLCDAGGRLKDVYAEITAIPGDEVVLLTFLDHAEYRPGQFETPYRQRALGSLFLNSPEGIVLVDVNGLITDTNPAFERMFGYSRTEMVGKRVDDVIVPQGLKREGTAITERVLAGRMSLAEVTRRRADGTEIVVSLVGVPVLVNGAPNGGFAIYRDVTARRTAQDRLADAFIDLVETTSRTMESADPYTAGHQRRVSRLTEMVGRTMGLGDNTLQGIYVGAMLHDIGKLSIPATILTKPVTLSPQEWALIRTHPLRGHAILGDAHLPWPVADMALRHHERLDGSGYPHGVKADALGIEVRILAACDVVEAMSSNRPYRPARPIEEVRREMKDSSGTKFDPDVVDTIVRLIDGGQIQPMDDYTGLADDRL
jgi:PAS domain S-box-containing protein